MVQSTKWSWEFRMQQENCINKFTLIKNGHGKQASQAAYLGTTDR